MRKHKIKPDTKTRTNRSSVKCYDLNYQQKPRGHLFSLVASSPFKLEAVFRCRRCNIVETHPYQIKKYTQRGVKKHV